MTVWVLDDTFAALITSHQRVDDRWAAISFSPNYTVIDNRGKDNLPPIIQQGYRKIMAEVQDLNATRTEYCDESTAKGR